VKTGFVTDQIFPRRVIEDLLHNSSEILRNMSTPVVGANTIFLPLKGPLEMMRKSPLIFLYPPNVEVSCGPHGCRVCMASIEKPQSKHRQLH
jgi:hypothetical protein